MIFAGFAALMIPASPLHAQDADNDGVPDAQDCQPTNNQLWRASTEARNLRLSGAATTNLTWTAPADAGGLVVPHYDVLRSNTANGFPTATCLSSGNTATNYADTTAPGSAFYLIRALQNCGGTLGTDSGGTPITGTNCGSCQVEYCNNLDDNCDNRADETFPNKGLPCTRGAGICAGTGSFICSGSQTSTICNAVVNSGAARDELCNGLDDTCDGQVDERVPAGGAFCFNGSPHPCTGWVDPMIHVGTSWVYQYEAARRDANSGSAGVDTTRACSLSSVQPWANVDEAGAAAACAAVRNSVNAPMRLCTSAEWTNACNLGNVTSNIWSYATTPTVYSNTTCNGYDRGLGVPTTTGASISCYANQAGGRIYDMSGDLWEWTSTPVVYPEGTYYKLRGGAYNNYSVGTNCNFDFTVFPAGTVLPDVGFRCCSDAAP